MEQSGRKPSRGSATWDLLGAVLCFLLVILLPNPEGLSIECQRLGALFIGVLVLGATEAVPIATTSLLALIFQPRAVHVGDGHCRGHDSADYAPG